jgi:Thiamine pyrophosphate enzyme, N-terminal TPP binding domain
MLIISPPDVYLGMRVRPEAPDMGRTGGVCALTAYHAHHRMTVRKGASLEASTASAASAGAGAIAAALARAGTRLMFGVPGGGPNLDVVGAAEAAGLRFILAHGETAATIMAATSADLTGTPGAVVVTRGPGLAAAAMGAAGAAVTSERELAAALADALTRPGPTVIDAGVDPAGYPAIMDLSRGQAGRRSVPGIGRANPLKEHAQ